MKRMFASLALVLVFGTTVFAQVHKNHSACCPGDCCTSGCCQGK